MIFKIFHLEIWKIILITAVKRNSYLDIFKCFSNLQNFIQIEVGLNYT